MTVHKIFWLCTLFSPPLLFAQTFNKSEIGDTLDVTYSVYRQFNDIAIQPYSNSIQFKFDSISEREYLNYKKEHKLDLKTDSTQISFHDNSFFMTAGDTVFKFGCPQPPMCAEYLGYYPILDCFMIGVQGPGIYERFLIDKETAKGLNLTLLNYDFADGPPLISPDGTSMVYYFTDHFEIGAGIVFFDIENHQNILTLDSCYTYDTSDWRIDDITWVNNNTIALKVYEELGRVDEQKNVRYLKTEIEEINTGANKK